MITDIVIYCGSADDAEKLDYIFKQLRLIEGLQKCTIAGVGPFQRMTPVTEEDFRVKEAMERLDEFAKLPEIPPLLPPMSKTELCQGRTDKQRREQDKWRRKFYKNK